MKSLTIDIGNSSAKLAVFAQGEICHRERVPKITCEMLDKILATHGIDEAILSSVAHADYAIDDFLNNRLSRYVRLSHVTPLPIGIDYATPHTLGTDRIATAVAAWELNPEAPSLVVDAGTAATIDVVDAKGNFCGGNIVAGLATRLKALNRYTGALPLVDAQGDVPQWGYDTVTALRSGAVLGLVAEIEATAQRIMTRWQCAQPVIFLTGGDAPLLAGFMNLPVRLHNDLLAFGLYRILRYNDDI